VPPQKNLAVAHPCTRGTRKNLLGSGEKHAQDKVPGTRATPRPLGAAAAAAAATATAAAWWLWGSKPSALCPPSSALSALPKETHCTQGTQAEAVAPPRCPQPTALPCNQHRPQGFLRAPPLQQHIGVAGVEGKGGGGGWWWWGSSSSSSSSSSSGGGGGGGKEQGWGGLPPATPAKGGGGTTSTAGALCENAGAQGQRPQAAPPEGSRGSVVGVPTPAPYAGVA
jgi:hypothetical protein